MLRRIIVKAYLLCYLYRFRRYQSRQAALAEIERRVFTTLPNGQRITVWGDAFWSPSAKGRCSAPVSAVRNYLATKGIVVLVDEHRTSMACSVCVAGCPRVVPPIREPEETLQLTMKPMFNATLNEYEDVSSAQTGDSLATVPERTRTSSVEVHGSLHCPNCKLSWQRDVNAALNIARKWRTWLRFEAGPNVWLRGTRWPANS